MVEMRFAGINLFGQLLCASGSPAQTIALYQRQSTRP